ncbi:holo-ACP synthase [Alkalicoccobacillus murimartini]|uniref:Holo-[acyl-carrier-protein] synthase n=1 Tax=Alkalicoccobacillus murimartini TaxID=171685 RepID=A0ABT9YMX6_9BACI|nr:holo-ACP synthase [Alkalicoccobacillus murimartini]MDQ0208557.1 holo-[acyl-carrier protein] synthase [Alkalicoccobacillus murimartini]
MIHGIGIDIIELERIEKALKRNARFEERILTEAERMASQKYSVSRKIEFLAGRFAAKEAFVKASGVKRLSWLDIEILNDGQGKPRLTGPIDGLIHVSISHSQDYAVAQVIIEGE